MMKSLIFLDNLTMILMELSLIKISKKFSQNILLIRVALLLNLRILNLKLRKNNKWILLFYNNWKHLKKNYKKLY